MRLSWTAFVFSACLLSTRGSHAPRAGMLLHEERDDIPVDFVNRGPATPDTMLDMRVALKMADRDGLETALLDVSTPSSPHYGRHLTSEEVRAFASPSPETTDAVSDWLASEGITFKVDGADADWITFSIPVSKANELLGASYENFVHSPTDVVQVRTMAYSLPEAISGHVDAVYPTTSITAPRDPSLGPMFEAYTSAPNVTADAVPASCNNVITPACLQALYGIPATPATQSSNKLGVTGFIEQYAQKADLRDFLSLLRRDINPNTGFALQSIDGGVNEALAGIEANLDIEYTVGLATAVPVTFISVGALNADGVQGFMDFAEVLAAERNPPQVVTTSYGFDSERGLGRTLSTRLCNSYMKLGARGVSVLFASGDGGVGGGQPKQNCPRFEGAFPATCPFITAVGGTHNIPETAVALSSGGFSNFFGTPAYQKNATAAYVARIGSMYQGMYNASGRGFPDVAAIGDKVEIVNAGDAGLVAGTSASSPIFASVIALINDRLIAARKPVLGFLNPWIYANPQAFNDITSGSNPGSCLNIGGFQATAGWDPATGQGTPNFSKMLAAAGL
ncbi:peptidase S8/S53 domain-containing protein [Schizophyllum amplum]|uniref:tripeptidyl-peptidase II n=1 Tax=Schizophyllum amplum TaxID=97359 RepID=A0A550CHH8_9AGAR|nr:peptidase S8/S53 domain-containing protein [Auriculariopsis ampla]